MLDFFRSDKCAIKRKFDFDLHEKLVRNSSNILEFVVFSLSSILKRSIVLKILTVKLHYLLKDVVDATWWDTRLVRVN